MILLKGSLKITNLLFNLSLFHSFKSRNVLQMMLIEVSEEVSCVMLCLAELVRASALLVLCFTMDNTLNF